MRKKILLTNLYEDHIRFMPIKMSLDHDDWETISIMKDEKHIIEYSGIVDCFFVFNYPINEEIQRIIISYKENGTPVLVMMDDPLAFFDYNINLYIEPILKIADKVFTSSNNMLPIYQSIGVKAEVMVGLANPQFDYNQPCLETEMKYDWGFIGTLTPQRFCFFWQLQKLLPELNFKIVTEGLNHTGVINLIRETKVNVVYGNFSDIIDFKSNATTFRAWEFPYAQAFIIHDFRSQLYDFFNEGDSVITFKSVEECADLIKYYHSRSDERMQIAQNARNIIDKFQMKVFLPQIFNTLIEMK